MRKGLPVLVRDLRASLRQHPGMGLQGKAAGGVFQACFLSGNNQGNMIGLLDGLIICLALCLTHNGASQVAQ